MPGLYQRRELPRAAMSCYEYRIMPLLIRIPETIGGSTPVQFVVGSVFANRRILQRKVVRNWHGLLFLGRVRSILLQHERVAYPWNLKKL